MKFNIAGSGEDRCINMSLSINFSFNNVNAKEQAVRESSSKRDEVKSIYVGNMAGYDCFAMRRMQAQKQAFKVVEDAWNSDKGFDDLIKERQESSDKLLVEAKENMDKLSSVNSNKEDLINQYSVDKDSKEQRDLDLLIKKQNYEAGIGEELTDEELEEVFSIDINNLTDYQKQSLELNEQSVVLKKNIESANSQIDGNRKEIINIGIERLKSNPMYKANKDAKKIMEAASKEILGMLIDEGKQHIEEKLEEVSEAAKEKEEEEEKLEDIREKRAIEKAMIEKTKEAAKEAELERVKNDMPSVYVSTDIELLNMDTTAEIKQSLNEIKANLKVLEADLKGIKVDKTI